VSPIATLSGTGINDDLDGVKQPARFYVKEAYIACEVVHALSKWKRLALADYGFKAGEGLITGNAHILAS
jgi:aspartate--ammonia ligase